MVSDILLDIVLTTLENADLSGDPQSESLHEQVQILLKSKNKDFDELALRYKQADGVSKRDLEADLKKQFNSFLKWVRTSQRLVRRIQILMRVPRISRDTAIKQWNAHEAGEGTIGLNGAIDYIGEEETPLLTDIELEDLIEELDAVRQKYNEQYPDGVPKSAGGRIESDMVEPVHKHLSSLATPDRLCEIGSPGDGSATLRTMVTSGTSSTGVSSNATKSIGRSPTRATSKKPL